MNSNNPYAKLFEPVKIGPVTAKNRFYQVPHCCGLGHSRPQSHAMMRGIKAEGGWAVVSTEETEIHPSTDLSPYVENRIWDDADIPALKLMTDAVHAHGALAAIELAHNGFCAQNSLTRIPPIAPTAMTVPAIVPTQAREMSIDDIHALRQWHRAAAIRAKQAGFDIIYVYAGHQLTITQHFLLPRLNQRKDKYGGSLENRVRLTRELLEDTKEAVGDRCAVAFRFAVDELMGEAGLSCEREGKAVVEMLAEIPDLWDVNVSDWSNDSATSRFEPEQGYQQEYVKFVKQVTSKPVVGVGRFTSADAMLSQVNQGILDLIGAARPSIADPFLPEKIRTGQQDHIRECIGCNICVASDGINMPIRCTQNPTMGQEWRLGWHPEKIPAAKSSASVLVVGAGPAGLECSLQLAKRGYQVTLAESGNVLGGRVTRESKLSGLSAWARVRDYREHLLKQMPNVEIYFDSELSARQILEFGFAHVFLATGSSWRKDGKGRSLRGGIKGLENVKVYTPDDVMTAEIVEDEILIYDDDQIYLAGVLAHHLQNKGKSITFVTPASSVSPWTAFSLEQHRIQKSLLEQGVEIYTDRLLTQINKDHIELECSYTGQVKRVKQQAVLLVTERISCDKVIRELQQEPQELEKAGIVSVNAIGDCYSPGLIADAVYSGHLAARSFERDPEAVKQDMFRREIPSIVEY